VSSPFWDSRPDIGSRLTVTVLSMWGSLFDEKSGLSPIAIRVEVEVNFYDRRSVGQSVLVSGAHLGPVTNFSVSLKFPLDSCRFVIL
jgi:hypothetical protein